VIAGSTITGWSTNCTFQLTIPSTPSNKGSFGSKQSVLGVLIAGLIYYYM